MLDWNVHACQAMDCGTLARNPDPDFLFSSSAVSDGGTSILFPMGCISSGFTDVRLELTAPLTDSGGTVPLILDPTEVQDQSL